MSGTRPKSFWWIVTEASTFGSTSTCASGSGVTKHDSKKNKLSLKRSSQHAPPVSGFYA